MHTTQFDDCHSLAAEFLSPLESLISSKFIPSLTGDSSPGELHACVLYLPYHTNPITQQPLNITHAASTLISAPLVDLILDHD